MEPLAAFQVLALALAAAMAVEGFKAKGGWRIAFWAVFGIAAVLGVLTNKIAAAWPAASELMGRVGSSPVTVFLVFLGVIALLQIPRRPRIGSELADGSPTALNDDAKPRLDRLEHNHGNLRDQFIAAEKVSESRETKMKAIIDDYQTVLGRLTQSADRMAIIEKNIAQGLTGAAQDRDLLRGDLEKLGSAAAEQNTRLRESLYAVYAREQMKDIEREIEHDAETLYARLAAGETYDANAWDKWQNVKAHWWGKLEAWLEFAQWYAPDVKGRVTNVSDEEYDAGEWKVSDSQLPGGDALRHFKRHRIIHSHWNEIRPNVHAGARRVAFEGAKESEVKSGR